MMIQSFAEHFVVVLFLIEKGKCVFHQEVQNVLISKSDFDELKKFICFSSTKRRSG